MSLKVPQRLRPGVQRIRTIRTRRVEGKRVVVVVRVVGVCVSRMCPKKKPISILFCFSFMYGTTWKHEMHIIWMNITAQRGEGREIEAGQYTHIYTAGRRID